MPGRIHIAESRTLVSTILGSCVSVTLFDTALHWGTINHFQLPFGNHEPERSACFGNVAIEQQIATMVTQGTHLRDVEAKIFGGACMHSRGSRRSMGDQNIDVARELLERHGIAVVAEDVGGDRGRRLVFDTGTGDVWIKRL